MNDTIDVPVLVGTPEPFPPALPLTFEPDGFTVDCHTLTLFDGLNSDLLTPDEAFNYCGILPAPTLEGDGFTIDCGAGLLFGGINSDQLTPQELESYCPPVAEGPPTASSVTITQPVASVPALADTGVGDVLAYVFVGGLLLLVVGFVVVTSRVFGGR